MPGVGDKTTGVRNSTHEKSRTMGNITSVQQRKVSKKDTLDDYPTPPWMTRALLEHSVVGERIQGKTVLEPAAGRGFMSDVLKSYTGPDGLVLSQDVKDYGYPLDSIQDFIGPSASPDHDWMITNPPFVQAIDFVIQGLVRAREGVAILERSAWLESKGRYEQLFRHLPPTWCLQFVERGCMYPGRVEPEFSGATSFMWFVWIHGENDSRMGWIPPCRNELRRPDDHVPPAERG